MVYMVIGVLFVIICGFDLAYTTIWLALDESDEPELEGHPVKFNKTGALIPVVRKFITIFQALINYVCFLRLMHFIWI